MTYDKLVDEVKVELKNSGINPDSAVVKTLLLKVLEIGAGVAWDEANAPW